MTGAMVTSGGKPDASRALALGATGGERPPASTALEAIQQAHALFSGVYGQRWTAAQNAQVAWTVVLGEVTPAEVAAAAIAHVRDTTKRDDGQLACDWPPTPGQILARIQATRLRVRENAEREAQARAAAERAKGRGR